jgi:hypothetical protein
MFNNLDSDLNAKDKFTCELSACGVDGSVSVVGRGNGGRDRMLYSLAARSC